jgi:tetratricopeptide (TPR) repeat protein
VSRSLVVAVCLVGTTVALGTPGCATFGRRSRAAAAIEEGRDFSRQGASAMQSGQWQQAEDLLQKGIDASPDDAELRRQLAEVLWQRGAVDEAMLQAAAAMRLKPDDATLTVGAGEMALASGAHEAALERAEDAIRLDPRLASAWALRGRAFRQMNQPERALADLQRSLVLGPDNAAILFELATMYRERGDHARCLTTVHHLHDTYSPGEEPQSMLLLEGLTLIELQRPLQASDVLFTATRRGPANADVFYHLAQAQSAAGQREAAETALQQALAIDATHQPSRALLAQLAATVNPAEPQRR